MTEPYKINKHKREYCPQCMANGRGHIRMQFHHAHIFHGIYDADRGVGIWACDEKWKCSKCRYVALFGFPLTKAMYDATLLAWRGNYEWTILSENEVARRFEELGYLDVRVKGEGIVVELPKPDVSPDTGVKKWGPKERVEVDVQTETS